MSRAPEPARIHYVSVSSSDRRGVQVRKLLKVAGNNNVSVSSSDRRGVQAGKRRLVSAD